MQKIFTKINKRRKMLPAFFVALLFIFVSIFSSFSFVDNAEAAINKEINYQGKLTLASGVAVPNSSISIVFSLYTAPSGGVAIWTETQSVTPSNGLFSVMLGENTALTSVNFNQTLYLGVKVGTDSEMTPRKKLGAVPAAIEAENAQTAQSATKATNLAGGNSSSLLGSIPYQSDTDTTSFVSPNVTLTKKFFTMTGTGTNGAAPLWEALVAGDVGLGNVTNENKATMFANPTFTGTISGITATMVGLGNATNENKATMFTSPIFTGTVAGFTTGGDISLGANTFTTSNNDLVLNLNADLLDGQQGSYYQPLLTNPITGTGTDGYLPNWNGTGSALENSPIFTDGTNVGIGTTVPNGKLDLVSASVTTYPTYLGDITAYPMYLRNSDTTTGSAALMSFGHGTDAWVNYIGSEKTANSGDLVFGGRPTAGGTFLERMRIQSSGNVGIGTTTPTSEFQVSSSRTTGYAPFFQIAAGKASGQAASVAFTRTNNTQQTLFAFETTNSSNPDGYFGTFSNKEDALYILTSTGTGSLAAIGVDSSLGLRVGTATNIVSGSVGASITPAGQAYFGGNVGIGTTTPTTGKLVIVDTTLAGSAALAGSVLNLAQTWNTTGSPTALKLNVTNTASGTASLLMDLQVGTVSQFSVSKAGNLALTGTLNTHTIPGGTGTLALISDIVSQVEDSIVDGHTTIAPSGNAVFDALALKAPLDSPTFTGTVAGFTMGGTLALGANTLTTSNNDLVSNLNADLLDGQEGSYYYPASNPNVYITSAGTATNFSGTLSGDVTGTQGATVVGDDSHSHTTSTLPSSYTALSITTMTGDVTGNVSGNSGTVTNGLYSTGSYSNPTWLTAVPYSILSGTVPTWNQSTTGNAATVTNGVYTSGSYSDPSWLTISKSKVGLSNVDNTADSAKNVLYATTSGGAPASDVYAWAKATTKPTYTASEVGLGNVTNESKVTMFTSPTFTGTVAGFTMGGDISLGANTFTTSNNDLVLNLNADLLDGQEGSYYQPLLTNPVTGTGTTNYLPKFTGTSALGNSLVYDDGTNVGIGTTSPVVKLDVAGVGTSGGSTGQMVLRNYSSTYSDWRGSPGVGIMKSHNNTIGINSATQGGEILGQFYFGGVDAAGTPYSSAIIEADQVGTAGTGVGSIRSSLSFMVANGTGYPTALFINKDGNVGIGTTTPVSLTEIQGGLTTTGALLTLGTKEPSVVLNDILGQINFYAPLDTGLDSDLTSASIVAIAEGTFSDTSNATSLQFRTGASEIATTKMTILSSGNVGIGTTTPGVALQVQRTSVGGAGVTIQAQDLATTGEGSLSIKNDNYYAGFELFGSAFSIAGLRNHALFTTQSGVTELGFATLGAAPITFLTNSTGVTNERMRITSDGNVGIGTTTPTTGKLVIVDTALAGSAALAGSVLDLTQTWNTSGSPTALKLNVTNTASGTTSLLMDLQVGTVSQFSVSKAGVVTAPSFVGALTGTASGNLATVDTTNGLGITGQQVTLGLASTSAHGALSDTDWNTFNGKQAALSGTGFVKSTAGVISYDINTYLTSFTETDPIWVAAESNYFNLGQNETVTGIPAFNGGVTGASAPFSVDSTYLVSNLNADLLDGQEGSYYQPLLTNPVTGTGTANYLPKFTGTSTLGNSLIYDDGTNVGIGTTVPETLLYLNSTNPVLTINAANGNAEGAKIRLSESALLQGAYIQYDGSSNVLNIGVHNTVDTIVANDLAAISILRSNGNVGIGTTSPGAKLEVVAGATDGVRISNSSGSPYGLMINNTSFGSTNSKGFGFAQDNNGIATIYNNNVGAVNITSLGNVGIGTTGPVSKLEVVGGGNDVISSANAVAKIGGDATTGEVSLNIGHLAGTPNYGVWMQAFRPTDDLAFQLLLNPKGGNVGIGTTAPTSKLYVGGGDITFDGGSTAYYSTLSSPWDSNHPFSLSVQGTERMGVYADGGSSPRVAFMNGNVGIGTTSPGAKLDIQPASDGDVGILVGKAGVSGIIDSPTNLYINADSDNNAASNVIAFGADRTGFTGGTEYMRIVDGNVGIGTTGPLATLDIRGALVIPSAISNTSARPAVGTARIQGEISGVGNGGAEPSLAYDAGFLRLSAGGGTTAGQKTFIDLSGGSPVADMDKNIVFGVANAEAMRIINNGNVGIGTTVPYEKLHIKGGNLFISNNSLTAGGLIGQIRFGTEGFPSEADASIKAYYNDPTWYTGTNLGFYTNPGGDITGTVGLQRMTILASGNVGIGTTSPLSKLSINGGLHVGGDSDAGDNNLLVDGVIKIGAVVTPPQIEIYDVAGNFDSGLNIKYVTGGTLTSGITIKNNGNVGIGTTAPYNKMGLGIVSAEEKYVTFDLPNIGSSLASTTMGFGASEIASNLRAGMKVFAVGNGSYIDYSLGFFTHEGGIANHQAMTILKNGNVGIGTTTPNAKLDVAGNTYLHDGSLYLDSVNGYSGGNITFNNTGNTTFSGNVGIGTTGPRSLFDVTSGTANTAGIAAPNLAIFTGPKIVPITDGSVPANLGIFSNTAQGADVGASLMLGGRYYTGQTVATGFAALYGAKENGTSNDLSGYLAFYTNKDAVTTEQMRINSRGNVGIGTASPRAKLEVSLSTSVRNTIVRPFIVNRDATGVHAYDGAGVGILFQGTDYSDYSEPFGAIDAVMEASSQWAPQPDPAFVSGLRFSTVPTQAGGLVEKMRILANGNVGIGTIDPAGYKLNVNGTQYVAGQLTIDGFGNNAGLSFRNGEDPANVGIRAKAITTANRDGLELLGYNGIDFSINNGATVAMHINGQGATGPGNVGIGTTTPGAKLDVNGSSQFAGVITLTDATYFLGSPSYGYRFNSYDSTYNNFIIYENGNTYTRGNVGIGTPTPDFNLEVETAVAGASTTLNIVNTDNTNVTSHARLRMATGPSGGDTKILMDNGGAKLWNFGVDNNDSDKFKFSSNSDGLLETSTLMTIQTDGNVGIGTTTPQNTLHIQSSLANGGIDVTNTQSYARILIHGGQVGDVGWGIMSGYPSVGDFNIRESGVADVLTIKKTSGNVGIGTTTPGNILTIQQTSATDPVADAWTVYSSGRWKEHRVPIVNALETIKELNPIYFDWKAEYGGAHDLGFIAEEVGLIIPEVVAWEDNGVDAKSIDYARLSTIAIAGVKEMNLNLSAITGIIIPTPGSQEEIFANSFFENLFTRIRTWLGNAGNGLEKIFVKEVNTETLCVSDDTGAKTCINKAQLDDLLVSVGFSSPLGGGAGGGDDGDVPPSVDDNLAKAKTDAEALTAENYTSESWGIFTGAFTTAQELPEGNDADKIAKTTALNDAVAGLEILVVEEVVTDLTAYDVAMGAKTETDYTLESWTTYMDVVNANVVTIVNSQTEIDAATSNITAAQVNLTLK